MKATPQERTGPPDAVHLSVVVPAYHEEGNLQKLYEELAQVLAELKLNWELIFVDDGSKDRTWEMIAALQAQDPRVKGLRFSRNFGHQYALYAGLANARGEAVVCMDADLQHPPALIPALVDEWRKGSKIVNTVRLDHAKLPWFKRVTSKLFYKVFSFLSGVKLEPGMADFRLFDRRALEGLLQFGEQGLFLRGLVQWIGYPSTTVTFQCCDRFSGASKYSLRKMLRFGLDGITSFSIIPLRLGIVLGAVTSLIAFWQMGSALYAKLVLNAAVPGWATTVTVLSFMFGILFILLGILGEYLGRILIEVRARPRFIVSETLGMAVGQREGKLPTSPLPFTVVGDELEHAV